MITGNPPSLWKHPPASDTFQTTLVKESHMTTPHLKISMVYNSEGSFFTHPFWILCNTVPSSFYVIFSQGSRQKAYPHLEHDLLVAERTMVFKVQLRSAHRTSIQISVAVREVHQLGSTGLLQDRQQMTENNDPIHHVISGNAFALKSISPMLM